METYILPIILISYTVAIVIYTNKTYSKIERKQ